MQVRQPPHPANFTPVTPSYMMYTGDGGFGGPFARPYRAAGAKPRPVQLMGKLTEESFELRQQLQRAREADNLYNSGKRNRIPLKRDLPPDSPHVANQVVLREIAESFLRDLEKQNWPVSIEIARARVNRCFFDITDPLPTNIFEAFTGPRPGSAFTMSGRVSLSESYFAPGEEKKLRIVAYHELMHVVSGCTYVKTDPRTVEIDDQTRIINIEALPCRGGLYFIDHAKFIQHGVQWTYPVRFEWLNEAVTQWGP